MSTDWLPPTSWMKSGAKTNCLWSAMGWMTCPMVSGAGARLGITQHAVPRVLMLRYVLRRFEGHRAVQSCW